MNNKLIALLAVPSVACAQATYHEYYGLDFTDPGWTNDTTGLSSEFQTNNDGYSGSNSVGPASYGGWDSSHSINSINGSTIGATIQISHKPKAFNIESRPALEPYFPSQFGNSGDILRVWNDLANIPTGEVPTLTMTFTESVSLQKLSLEGYRKNDAWKIQAYDAQGNLVSPNWADPSVTATVNPGDPLSNVAINLLSMNGVNGASGAEALSEGTYNTSDKSFFIYNKNKVQGRGGAVLDYNLATASVKTIVYTMMRADTNGDPSLIPSQNSMYFGSGVVAKEFQLPVPEPSSTLLLGLGGLSLLARRKR